MSTAGAGQSSESDAYAWLQYAADGLPHVRVIPSDRAACPSVIADDAGIELSVSVLAEPGFDRVLCDAALPAAARKVSVGGVALPPLPRRIERFIVLGDTGCLVARTAIQNCRDAAAWPFARIAQAIAHEAPRPDLIVHTGNYEERAAPCPARDARCAGLPDGDSFSAWAVDFFEPGAPLFATAPLLWVRGAAEACDRAGVGWSRYLAPVAQADCTARDPSVSATFDDLRFIDVDSADAAAGRDASQQTADEPAGEAAADRETFVVTHQLPPAGQTAPAGVDVRPLAAIITGQPRLFAALPFAGAPAEIVVGTGGSALSAAELPALLARPGAFAQARFGYAVFDRMPNGWAISVRDPDGRENRRCILTVHTVHC